MVRVGEEEEERERSSCGMIVIGLREV